MPPSDHYKYGWMSTGSRAKAAFITQSGLYEFKVAIMPFGLCKAPAMFQRVMQTVLAGLEDFTE